MGGVGVCLCTNRFYSCIQARGVKKLIFCALPPLDYARTSVCKVTPTKVVFLILKD